MFGLDGGAWESELTARFQVYAHRARPFHIGPVRARRAGLAGCERGRAHLIFFDFARLFYIAAARLAARRRAQLFGQSGEFKCNSISCSAPPRAPFGCFARRLRSARPVAGRLLRAARPLAKSAPCFSKARLYRARSQALACTWIRPGAFSGAPRRLASAQKSWPAGHC